MGIFNTLQLPKNILDILKIPYRFGERLREKIPNPPTSKLLSSPIFSLIDRKLGTPISDKLSKPLGGGLARGQRVQAEREERPEILGSLVGRAEERPEETELPVELPIPKTTPTPETETARNPDIARFTIVDDVHGAIKNAATKFGVPSSLLYDIALYESSFDASLQNTTPEGVAAGNPTGLFQFTDDTWKQVLAFNKDTKSSLYQVLPNENRQDPETNALAAAYLIFVGQLGKWDDSEGGWGEFWTPEELEELGFYDQTLFHKEGMRASDRLRG